MVARCLWYLLLLLYGFNAPVCFQSNGATATREFGNFNEPSGHIKRYGWIYENTVATDSWLVGCRRQKKPFLRSGIAIRNVSTGIARVRRPWGGTMRVCFCVLGLGLATGASGEVLPGLNVEWAFRKSEECELILAAGIACQLMNQLVSASMGGVWPGKFRDIYNNAGRAIRLCDSIQHRCMEAGATKGICQY
jgi:hypothetical protein